MRRIASLVSVALVFSVAAPWPAWPQQDNHEEHETVGWVPREILERPVPLRRGIGTIHEKVTTASSQAQAFYDQALAYLHSYVWIEAARSFNQAIRLDPRLAMAYIGLSDVFVGLQDVPGAQAALQKAASLKDKSSEAERRRIEIRARQLDFLTDSHNLQRYFAYRQAISDALASNPADPWLWIFRGFADEGTPTAHGQNGGVDTVAFYQTALALSPDNFVAHHYLAHSFEKLGQSENALAEAKAYVRLAPSIPHAHHMFGHDLRRLGRTEEAIQEFRRADELESDYYRSENIAPEYDWHHAHNLNLLAMCYQALGQMKSAEQLLRESFSLPAHTDVAELNRSSWPEFLLHQTRDQDAFDAARDLLKSNSPMVRFAGHALAGRALLAMHRTDEARDELVLAEQEENVLPASLQSLPYADALRAELLLREGSQQTGETLMKQVAEKIRAVPGPDAWSQSLFQLESIANIARETGAWGLAEFTAQQMIQQDSSYAGGYYALGLCAEHRGDSDQVREQFAIAERLWNKADSNLPEMGSIRQGLAALH